MLMSQTRAARARSLWGLVLAAGDGRRLQDFIRQTRGADLPKQFISFTGKFSMLEQTYRRAEKLIRPEQILTIVGKHHLQHSEVKRQLARRNAATIIVQPQNKETGPGVLLPLLHLYKRDPQAIVTIFPSDQFILQEERFMEHVALAAQAIANNSAQIVMLAMEPNAPEVEYGYILPQPADGQIRLWGTRQAATFIEKPNRQMAQELVMAGGLWNTMIMVFKVHTMLELMRQFCPAIYYPFVEMFDAIGTPKEAKAVEALYDKIKPLNFSRDFLEKVTQTNPPAIAVLPVLGVYWSDWGSPARLVENLERLEQVHDVVSSGKSTTRRHPTKRPISPTFPLELR